MQFEGGGHDGQIGLVMLRVHGRPQYTDPICHRLRATERAKLGRIIATSRVRSRERIFGLPFGNLLCLAKHEPRKSTMSCDNNQMNKRVSLYNA